VSQNKAGPTHVRLSINPVFLATALDRDLLLTLCPTAIFPKQETPSGHREYGVIVGMEGLDKARFFVIFWGKEKCSSNCS
jgi:hypothetical protein